MHGQGLGLCDTEVHKAQQQDRGSVPVPSQLWRLVRVGGSPRGSPQGRDGEEGAWSRRCPQTRRHWGLLHSDPSAGSPRSHLGREASGISSLCIYSLPTNLTPGTSFASPTPNRLSVETRPKSRKGPSHHSSGTFSHGLRRAHPTCGPLPAGLICHPGPTEAWGALAEAWPTHAGLYFPESLEQ